MLLTILIGLNLQLRALLDTLRVAQHQLDAEVGEWREIVDSVLRIATLSVITHFLTRLLLAGYSVPVLDGKVIAVAAGHVIAQRFPAHCNLFGLDVHHFQPPWAVHRLWRNRKRRKCELTSR